MFDDKGHKLDFQQMQFEVHIWSPIELANEFLTEEPYFCEKGKRLELMFRCGNYKYQDSIWRIWCDDIVESKKGKRLGREYRVTAIWKEMAEEVKEI